MQVVPLTSNVDRLYLSEANITLNGKQNKAMADQIATVSKGRLSKAIGRVSASDMLEVERAIKKQLGLVDEQHP